MVPKTTGTVESDQRGLIGRVRGKTPKGVVGDLFPVQVESYSRMGTKAPGAANKRKRHLRRRRALYVCGRSSSFVEPGWDEYTSAQVWPRHQAGALFSELAVKNVRSAEPLAVQA